jgi:hypothetical protein
MNPIGFAKAVLTPGLSLGFGRRVVAESSADGPAGREWPRLMLGGARLAHGRENGPAARA